MSILCKDRQNDFFQLENRKIFPIFDRHERFLHNEMTAPGGGRDLAKGGGIFKLRDRSRFQLIGIFYRTVKRIYQAERLVDSFQNRVLI